MAEEGVTRKLAAILAADVAGYTRLMEADEEATLTAWWSARKDIIDPAIAEHGGRIVKHTGDGFLAEFATATEAVRCAVIMQNALLARNVDTPEDRRFEFRVGINLGEIVVDEEDIYGDGVNIAARVEALAEPGGICVTATVYDQIKNKLVLGYEYLGEHNVKHIAEPLRIYRVHSKGEVTAAARKSSSAVRWRYWAALAAVVAALFGAAGIIYWRCDLYPFSCPLTLWTDLNQREFSVFTKKILPEFENWQRSKGNKPVTVNVENVKHELVLARLKRGEKVDLITFDVNGYRRVLVEPEELIRDLSNEKGLLPSAVHPTMAKNLEINGKRYFIQFRGNIRLVFLNIVKLGELKTLCNNESDEIRTKLSYNLVIKCQNLPDEIRTWQQFKDIAEIFNKMEGEDRVAIAATTTDKPLFLFELVRLAVGEPCDMATGELGAVKEVMEFIKNDLWPHVRIKSREVDWRTAGGFLLSDSVYLARDWTFSLSILRESGRSEEFDIYEGLTWDGAKPLYLLGGEFLAMPKSGDQPELAKELLRFLVSREAQRIFVEELSWPAMRVDVASRSKTQERIHQERVNKAMLEAAPVPDYWNQQTRQFYENLFERVVDPTSDVEDAVAEFWKHWPAICSTQNR